MKKYKWFIINNIKNIFAGELVKFVGKNVIQNFKNIFTGGFYEVRLQKCIFVDGIFLRQKVKLLPKAFI